MQPQDGAFKGVQFPKMSTGAMLVLQIFTGGLFGALWLAERKDRFNAAAGEEIVHTRDLVRLSIFLGLPLLFGGAGDTAPSTAVAYAGLLALLGLAAAVVMILISLRLTAWIRVQGQQEFGEDHFRTNKLWAFLFPFIYQNYKLNELQQLGQNESSEEAP